MELKKEEYGEIVAALAASGKSTRANLRGSPRIDVIGRVTIIPLGDSHRPVDVVVRNLSLSGICIIRRVEMRAEDQFLMRLSTPAYPSPKAMLCVVEYCR